MRGVVEARAAAEHAALNTPLARALRDQCPVCPGDLDTGFECNECGFDAWSLVEGHLNGK